MSQASVAMTGALWTISLLHGTVPVVVEGVAPLAVLVAAVTARSRWRALIGAAAATAAVVASLAGLVHRWRLVAHYPPTFLLWAALPVFAIGEVVAAWPGRRWPFRLGTIAVVPVTVAFCLLMVNAHYAYMPTVGDVFGPPLAHQSRLAMALKFAAVGSTASTDSQTPPAAVPFDRVALGAPSRVPRAGAVVSVRIPAPVSHFRHRQEYVYLPPAWFRPDAPRLPVVVMLAGTPGRPDDWLRAGQAAATVDAWAAAHRQVAPIVVFPDHNGSFMGDTECVDGARGRAETYLSEDVPNFVLSALRADPDPAKWGVVGLSEGGTCALELVLRHPGRFRHFVDLSGDANPNLGRPRRTLALLYGGRRDRMTDHDSTRLLSHADPRITAWFGAGRQDRGPLSAAVSLAEYAQRAGLATRLDIQPGGHDFTYWTAAWARAAPALFARLGE